MRRRKRLAYWQKPQSRIKRRRLNRAFARLSRRRKRVLLDSGNVAIAVVYSHEQFLARLAN